MKISVASPENVSVQHKRAAEQETMPSSMRELNTQLSLRISAVFTVYLFAAVLVL